MAPVGSAPAGASPCGPVSVGAAAPGPFPLDTPQTGGIGSLRVESLTTSPLEPTVMSKFVRAERLDRLPPYLFVEIDRVKGELALEGKDVVDLGIGDPDLPTFPEIVEALAGAARDPATHRYPAQRGDAAFKRAIAAWFESRYGVALDPEREILVLIGTKEGIGHLPLAVLNHGDTALVPDPAFPIYPASVWLAGGEVEYVPLDSDDGFLPDFEKVPGRALDGARLLFLNYPNNPTGAVADLAFFERALETGREHGFLVLNDAAYSEVVYEGPRVSLMQAKGGRENGIEFHSFSKTFNMTGWRLGFAVGNPEALEALAKVKDNVDSCVFTAIQRAGEAALALPPERLEEQVDIYRRRRDVLVDGLRKSGWLVPKPAATFYVWARVPTAERSRDFAERVLTQAHVVTTPGVGFGESGDFFIRMALTTGEDRIAEAVDRIVGIL
jgi:LL-diaminopimelate aminotransferase